MKKWAVLVIVVLFGALMALQYLSRKKARVDVPAPAAETGQQASDAGLAGVELPEGATGYIEATGGPQAEPAAYGSLPMLTGNDGSIPGACQGGTLNDILGSHGKIWGPGTYKDFFTTAETKTLFGLLEDFFACRAVASRNPASCSFLPADYYGNRNAAMGSSPFLACSSRVDEVMFFAYLNGRETDRAFCQRFFAGDFMKGVPLSEGQFCAAAAKGRDGLKELVTGGQAAGFKNRFPASLADCGSSRDCLDRARLYMAMKSGNSSDCAGDNKDLCAAYLGRTMAPCTEAARKASAFYCETYGKLLKKAGSPAGTPVGKFVEEQNRKKEEAKTHTERRKAEEEIIKQTNMKVRKALKKGGE